MPTATLPDEQEEVLTLSECAKLIRRSRVSLYELMRRRDDPIPYHRPGGPKGYAVFLRNEVMDWLARQ